MHCIAKKESNKLPRFSANASLEDPPPPAVQMRS